MDGGQLRLVISRDASQKGGRKEKVGHLHDEVQAKPATSHPVWHCRIV